MELSFYEILIVLFIKLLFTFEPLIWLFSFRIFFE